MKLLEPALLAGDCRLAVNHCQIRNNMASGLGFSYSTSGNLSFHNELHPNCK